MTTESVTMETVTLKNNHPKSQIQLTTMAANSLNYSYVTLSIQLDHSFENVDTLRISLGNT